MADKKVAKEPQYDHAELKRELTTVQGFDFEIHDDFTLMRVKSRNNGPLALVRMRFMPRTTQEFIHVVRLTFLAQLHPICTSFTLMQEKARTYTRHLASESYSREQAMKEFKLGLESREHENILMSAVMNESGDTSGPALEINSSLSALEWGTSDGKSNRLRQDVVKKTANVFGKF